MMWLLAMVIATVAIATTKTVTVVRRRRARTSLESAPQLITQVTCAKTGPPVINHAASTPQVPAQLITAAPPPRDEPEPARILVGIRPDAGTAIAIPAHPLGWPPWVDTIEDGPAELAGLAVVVERSEGELLLVAKGQAKLILILASGHARLIMGRRARDTLGSFAAWADFWLPWAFRLIRNDRLAAFSGTNALEQGDSAGLEAEWVDLAVEIEGGPELVAGDEAPERWTGGIRPTQDPLPEGEIYSLTIGRKNWAVSLYGYRKDKHVQTLRDGAGEVLLEVWRVLGWDGVRPVWRFEVRFRGDGRRLRLDLRRHRGATKDPIVDLTKLATLNDPRALERAWVHVVGHPDADVGGLYRMIVPRRMASGELELPTRCEVDPRWRIVQSAAAQAPLETLAQCRVRTHGRERWRERAQASAMKAIAEHVALDGFAAEDSDAARELGSQRAQWWLEDRERWRLSFGRARSVVQDLIEDAAPGRQE